MKKENIMDELSYFVENEEFLMDDEDFNDYFDEIEEQLVAEFFGFDQMVENEDF